MIRNQDLIVYQGMEIFFSVDRETHMIAGEYLFFLFKLWYTFFRDLRIYKKGDTHKGKSDLFFNVITTNH